MRRLVPFGWVFVYLVGGSALLAGSNYEIVQPVESRSNLVLETVRGKARVERQGAAPQRIALRSDELLTTIAETQGGWTAAGVRQKSSSSHLILIDRSARGTRRVATPELQRHALQVRPSLAVQGERLDGLTWLEGPDLGSMSVRAASRDNGEWGEVTVVSPPARGSQTGLVNAVLGDGSWLLVWSAFDGSDDELLWSVGRDERWTVPQGVDKNNSTPDIMPALVATSDGALLVWSRRVKGEYRLMMSRYRSGGWSRVSTFGPPGSLEPGFAVQGNQLLLLYRHAWPRGWAVNEISERGRIQRIAVSTDSDSSRPALLGSDGENLRLRFTDRDQRSVPWEVVP